MSERNKGAAQKLFLEFLEAMLRGQIAESFWPDIHRDYRRARWAETGSLAGRDTWDREQWSMTHAGEDQGMPDAWIETGPGYTTMPLHAAYAAIDKYGRPSVRSVRGPVGVSDIFPSDLTEQQLQDILAAWRHIMYEVEPIEAEEVYGEAMTAVLESSENENYNTVQN